MAAYSFFREVRWLILCFFAAWVGLVPYPSAGADAGTRKKSSASKLATPAPTKKKPSSAPSPRRAGETPDEVGGKAKTRQPKATQVEPEEQPSLAAAPSIAATASISPADLVEFHSQPAAVQKLIESGLNLTRQNLTYTFGSADPSSGGMDCSGFTYYLLRQHGFTQAPRDSSGLYVWARKAHGFRAVISRKADSFEMDELLPGDLLFWVGTYSTDHDPPISHVMIYLGTEKSGGGKVMLGSSDGRTYHGEKRNGVSVFDFHMPRTPTAGEQRSTFVGYARIPGLRD